MKPASDSKVFSVAAGLQSSVHLSREQISAKFVTKREKRNGKQVSFHGANEVTTSRTLVCRFKIPYWHVDMIEFVSAGFTHTDTGNRSLAS